MRQKVLATKAVYTAQTGIVVAEEIGDILKEFCVFDKVVAVTVDNAANMDVAIKRLQFVKLGCFAHTLNLAAQSLYSSSLVAQWTAKIRAIIVWMKRSSMAKVVLREKQDVLKGDFTKAEHFIRLMRVLYTCTLCVSTEKSPSAGQILPIIQKLEKHFAPLNGDTAFVADLKNRVWRNLSARYKNEDIRFFLEEATALDPRFKNKMVNNAAVWERIKGKLLANSEESAPAAVHDHAEEVSVTQGEGNQEGLKTDSEEEEENQPPPSKQSKKSPLEELFAEEDAMKRTSQEGVMSMESRAEREIQTYLEIPSIITSSDPAAWFWTQKQTYPLLQNRSVFKNARSLVEPAGGGTERPKVGRSRERLSGSVGAFPPRSVLCLKAPAPRPNHRRRSHQLRPREKWAQTAEEEEAETDTRSGNHRRRNGGSKYVRHRQLLWSTERNCSKSRDCSPRRGQRDIPNAPAETRLKVAPAPQTEEAKSTGTFGSFTNPHGPHANALGYLGLLRTLKNFHSPAERLCARHGSKDCYRRRR
uniref:Transposase n=1 Tax=Knipowitschia caucasica TaxID=637954 RepID=A0AAV2KJE6_KNICA